MINNIEGQSKAELIKIIECQQEHDQQREQYIKSLQAEVERLKRYDCIPGSESDTGCIAVKGMGYYMPLPSYVELQQRVEELERACLNSKVVDLVRCGIGANYGGSCYEKAIAEIYEPIQQLRAGNGGGE